MAQGVMVITEHWENSFRKISCEAICEGRRIADKLGESLTAVVLGDSVKQLADDVKGLGAHRILVAEDEGLQKFTAEAFVNVICDLIAAEQPKIVLLGATSRGKELSARIAARLDVGLAMECTALKIEDDRLVATRPIYGGKLISEVDIQGTPQMATIRPNVMEISEFEGEAVVESVAVSTGEIRVELLEENINASAGVELTEADYVVAGGRGMGGEDFAIVEELAALLGGAVGASRNAVDAGWRPQSEQVGQTGKVVSPKLYIACGISGAMQHVAGMSTSDVIVAVNSDPDALIFRAADYCIVDDLFKVVPAITSEIRSLKG